MYHPKVENLPRLKVVFFHIEMHPHNVNLLVKGFKVCHCPSASTSCLVGVSWIRNTDYYRLDGSTTATSRRKWTELFNDTTNVRYVISVSSTYINYTTVYLITNKKCFMFDDR